jgi:hypothetical protein
MNNNQVVDFLGIGVEKGGTTWLAKCMEEHPQICFSKNREVYFFNDVDSHFLKEINTKYSRGVNWYKSQFSHCPNTSKKGEYATTYLFTDNTARRIKKHLPDVLMIASLRDPVKRTFSQYLYEQRLGFIQKNERFEDVLKERPDMIEKGFYAKHLRNYYKYFSKKQIHVVIFEELIENPKKHFKKLFNFLGVDNNFTPSRIEKPSNKGGAAVFPKLNYLMIKSEYILRSIGLDPILRLFEFTGVRGLAMKVRDINKVRYSTYPRLKKDTSRKLFGVFEKDINELEKMLNKNLETWKKPYLN